MLGAARIPALPPVPPISKQYSNTISFIMPCIHPDNGAKLLILSVLSPCASHVHFSLSYVVSGSNNDVCDGLQFYKVKLSLCLTE
jgi:hypothetical protein